MANAIERTPAWSLAIVSMFSAQIGSAISVQLFDDIGVAGTAWLRFVFGALIIVAIARPRYWRLSWRELRAPVLLGFVAAGMALSFLAAISLIPLGTAVAIQFLGPLSVAAIYARGATSLFWPALAFVGVIALTGPWAVGVNPIGVALAAVAGVGWGLYIVITQHVGEGFNGVEGPAISLPIAALVTTPVGLPEALGHINFDVLVVALVSALLIPVIPWTLELYALRRITKSAFGTLQALEPAIALMIGMIVLSQAPHLSQIIGIVCVVIASVSAQNSGRRGGDPPILRTQMK